MIETAVFNSAAVAGLISFLTALLLVLTKKLHGSATMDFCDGVQKFHTVPTPRVGGIAIMAGLMIGSRIAPDDVQSLVWPLIIAGIPAFAFGLLEDLTKHVGVRTRLLATITSGILGWAVTGAAITSVNLPALDWLLSFTLISVAFTAVAVGGVANAINIIDGFNGLAAGTVIIILIAFGLVAIALDDTALAATSVLMAGAVAGFMLVNWPLGKIFLGDGGAYFAGFAVAWIAILMTARHPQLSAWAPLLACSYPILEVGFSFVRKSRRVGHHPGQPDKVHLHMLMHRRLTRRMFPNVKGTLQNSLTSPFAWIFSMVPAAWAAIFYDNTASLIFGFAGSLMFYWLIYLRLSQFTWCFSPRSFPGREPVKAAEAAQEPIA